MSDIIHNNREYINAYRTDSIILSLTICLQLFQIIQLIIFKYLLTQKQ